MNPPPVATIARAAAFAMPGVEGPRPAASPAEVRAGRKTGRPSGMGSVANDVPQPNSKVLTPSGRVPGIIKHETTKRGSRIPWERATLPLLPAGLGLLLFAIGRVAEREASFDEYIGLRNVRIAAFIGAGIGVIRIFMGYFEVNAPPSAKAKTFRQRFMARMRVHLLKASPRLRANALRDLGEFNEAGEVLLAGGFLREAGQEFLRANEVAKAAKVFEKLNDADAAVKAYNKLGDTRAATVAFTTGRYAEAARLFLKHGEHLQAAEAWQRAGEPVEAANAFEAASRPEEAGIELVRALENGESPFARLSREDRHKLAVRAADLLVRAGAALGAAHRFERLGEPELAAGLFEQGGDFAEAGRIASERGEHEKAAELYTKGGRLLAAAKARGEALMAAGRKSGTGAFARSDGAAAPADKEALKNAATCFESAGEPDRAADLYARAGDLENAARLYEKAGFAREAALCHRERGDLTSAARALEHSDPIAAAEAYAAAGDTRHALEVLASVSNGSPRRGKAVALLGDMHLKAGHESEAIAAFAQAIEGSTRSQVLDMSQVAHCLDALASLGHLDDAIEQLSRMRKRVGDSPDIDRMMDELNTRKRTSIGGNDLVGCTIDRYRAATLLGEGATAWVYKAEHTFLGRTIALKVLKPNPMGSGDLAERFYTEAQAVAGLRHPNVIHVYDVGATPGGLLYMALELVSGDGLRRRLERQPKVPIGEAVKIMTGVLSGLALAHSKGIVHRDLKPENILLTPDGQPKVVDFGIAKVVQTKSVTMTGTFIGTPKYASPEQAQGMVELTTASDLYACGLILYEMLAGRSPFESESPLGFLTKHATAVPVPIADLVKDIPAPLAAAVMRALEKDPAQRWNDADTFRRAIAPFAVAKSGFSHTGDTVSAPLPADHVRHAHTSVDLEEHLNDEEAAK